MFYKNIASIECQPSNSSSYIIGVCIPTYILREDYVVRHCILRAVNFVTVLLLLKNTCSCSCLCSYVACIACSL